MRWMNRLTTALIVLAVVAGPPLLAGAWLLHHPWRAPTRTQMQAWAEQPLTAGTVIAGCVIVAGLGWLLLLIHLTRRALAELRRRLRRLRHLPVPTPAQMTASSMAGLAAFTLPAPPAGHPQPSPTTTGTPQLPDPAGFARHADRTAQTQPVGITLPGGGWIPYRTAAVITALAAALWLQRRRYYRPDPHQPHDHHNDPDLQQLPDTVHTITTAVTGDETSRHDHAVPPLMSQPLPDGVLLLTGPGAAAAARGLLVTDALSDTVTVFVRPGDLDTLLPADDLVHLTVAELAAATGQDSSTRTVVVLGDALAATHHWHVNADGTATGDGLTEPRRLCNLDPRTTTDLLSLARLRHQPTPSANQRRTPAHSQPTEPAATSATAAHLTLLGGCHLTAAGGPVHLRRSAGLQILAYLAVHPRGATRTELIRAVWPDLPTATISQRLHTTLADLRQQLRPLLGEDPISRDDDRYRLNDHAIATDLQQWRTATFAMTHAVGSTAQHDACRDVVDMYRGELAAEYAWPWLTPAREQTRRTVIDACAALAEHADPDEALKWLRIAIAIDQYNETLHHQAAKLLSAAGDTSGAADLITRLHRRLADRTLTPP